MKEVRKVRIERLAGGEYVVCYVERKKYQRHWAAQFNRMSTLAIAFWSALIIANGYFAHDKQTGGTFWTLLAMGILFFGK